MAAAGSERGFTLAEIIATMVIIAVLAVGMFSASTYSKSFSLRAQEKAVGVALAEKKMSELKLKGAANLLVRTMSSDCDSGSPPSCCSGSTGPGACCDGESDYCENFSEMVRAGSGTQMTGSVDSTIVEVDGNPRLKEVEAAARWRDRKTGTVRTESLVTFMYQE